MDWLNIFSDNMYFFFLSYTILGGGIKFIDSAFDDKTFNKKEALIIAPFLGVFWAYTMAINQISATILLAVLLGVLLKGKIDNYAHLIGLISIVIFDVLIIIFIDGAGIMLLPLIFLTSASVLDEVGNDVMEYNSKYIDTNTFRYQFTLYFFGRRYLMKVAILFISLLGIIPLYFLLAFLLFDETYIMVGIYSKTRINKIKS